MATISVLSNASQVLGGDQTFNVVQNVYNPPVAEPLKELAARITAGAIHDSDERCDAPKCHPDTRVAVQDDLYSWIVDGDRESENPKKTTWVTGPAGSGKTAVMGSLAGRCAANGLLGGTFFFASWSASTGRRQKTTFVATIAHQLALQEDLQGAISTAIERNRGVFEKNLHVQMEILVLAPLREVVRQSNGPGLRGAIIIDGLDECEAVQYHDTTSTRTRDNPVRTNAQDQLDILQVLRTASLDPSFPFRIVIASRPERVFREFFGPEENPTLLAQKIDLHEDYDADADIKLFFKARFREIRRRYHLPPSWPPPGTIEALVRNASGQFIYAATVIRLLDTGHQEPPKVLLEAILEIEAKQESNPLKQLDNLYSHILESSPNPLRSVLWIRGIQEMNEYSLSHASNLHLLFETDPAINEAEYLLGNLHSLIRIPPLSNQATTKYDFYHKTLFDFLKGPNRSGKLHLTDNEVCVFLWDSFNRACTRGCDAQFSYPKTFLTFLVYLPNYSHFIKLCTGSAHSKIVPTAPAASWWASLAVTQEVTPRRMFRSVHEGSGCTRYLCKPACKIWRKSLMCQWGMNPLWLPFRLGELRLVAVTLEEQFDRAVREVVDQLE